MKKKFIAIILAAAMSCQPVITYAAETEMDFNDSSESVLQNEATEDNLNEDESAYNTENPEIEGEGSFDNTEDLLEDEESSYESEEDLNNENIEKLEEAQEDSSITDADKGKELEFSDGEDDWSDGSDQGIFSSESQSETPDYDVWLGNTVMSGLNMNGTTYGNSMYELFKQMQEPIYAELGGLILDDVPLMSISSVWNDVIKKNFYNNQKLIYETLLMEYIKYENKTNASSFNTSQVDRANAYLIKMFNKLADKYLDEGVQNWSPDKFMSMSVEDAIKSFENVETMQKTLKLVQSASKNTKELLTLASTVFSLNDAKQEKIQLIKNARNACAGMKNPNNDFIAACDEVVGQMESVVIDISYARTQSADKAVDKIISTVWGKLSSDNPILKAIDLGSDTMDILFNTSDAASNNLKLSILYTMDCYFKMGLSNAATQYMSHPTDNEAAQTFNSCFTGYVNFQIYGNYTAKSWISSVTDGGALNHAFTYIFYRENLKNASELKNLCDSQNKTRSQILNIICKYQDIYSNLYMKDEYKQAMSQPITPTPVVDSKDYNISEGITSPNTVEESGKCGDSAYWKLFKNGMLIIYGTGSLYENERNEYWSLWAAYYNKIKMIKIADGITKIGDYEFQYCEQLKSLTISSTVKEIGNCAFGNCSSLTTITGGNRLEKIGYGAFVRCEQLKNVTIPNTVKEIGDFIFKDCKNLITVGGGSKLQKIGSAAFENCEQLKSITISNTVKEIGDRTFEECKSLNNVKLGSNLEKIGLYAFLDCEQLKNITIPNTVKEIGNSAFKSCKNLTTITLGNNLEKIGSNTFESCKQLKSITIPNTVKEIGEYTFGTCTSLVSIKLGSNLEKIGSYAFWDCEQLRSITLPNTVKEIGDYTFGHCKNLTNIKLGNKLEKIGSHVFGYCEQLKNITLPNTVKEIGDYAFEHCNSLADVKLGNKLEKIGSWVFEYCEQLHNITIPNTVKEIGRDIFWLRSRLIIYGYPDSYAQFYAKQYNISFVILKDPEPTATPALPTGKFAVKLSATTVVYNGKTQTPSVTVTYKGKKLSSKYYTVKYINNKNIGTATVTVTGKGTYKKCFGKATFKIALKTGTVSNLKAGKKYITLSWKTVTGSTGYQIQYSTSKNFAKAKTVKISGAGKHSTTIKKLTSKKTYYVRIRAYKIVNKKTVYGAWSVSKKVVVK